MITVLQLALRELLQARHPKRKGCENQSVSCDTGVQKIEFLAIPPMNQVINIDFADCGLITFVFHNR